MTNVISNPLHTFLVLLGVADSPQVEGKPQGLHIGARFFSLLQRTRAVLLLEGGELDGQCAGKCLCLSTFLNSAPSDPACHAWSHGAAGQAGL